METQSKWMYILQSRKLWASVIGLVLVLVASWGQDPFPTETIITAIVAVVAAYVGATALEDGLTARDTTSTKISAPKDSNVTVVASSAKQDVAQSAPVFATLFDNEKPGTTTITTPSE
jgi:hypothetical protein